MPLYPYICLMIPANHLIRSIWLFSNDKVTLTVLCTGMGGSRCKGCIGSSVDLRRQEERLRTFSLWANGLGGAESLAAQGFYFTGTGGEVQCKFCGLQVDLELEGGRGLSLNVALEVQQVHRDYARDCDLLQHRQCGNIPLNEFTLKPFSSESVSSPAPPQESFRSDQVSSC